MPPHPPPSRIAERAEALSLSSLLCLGRHTVTGLLTTCGQEFRDWSAPYRLFSCDRLSTDQIFVTSVMPSWPWSLSPAPLCVAIDDSLLRKTGIRIHGVAWRRDPLGPRFQTNFVRAQRYLQFSAAVPCPTTPSMVPIDFTARRPLNPSRKPLLNKDPSIAKTPSASAVQQIALRQRSGCRSQRDSAPAPSCVDGGYTNDRLEATPSPHHPDRPPSQRRQAVLPAQRRPARRGRPRRYGAPPPLRNNCAPLTFPGPRWRCPSAGSSLDAHQAPAGDPVAHRRWTSCSNWS